MVAFRDLKAEEIECRVAMAKGTGVSLLLYKDARCDMTILDETVGAENWQRKHTRDNANCIVSIWCAEKGQWVEKEDTGKESNTEAEKGLASDSFKRACFNWGIGRELYTAPFIWVMAKDLKDLKQNGSRYQCFDTFKVDKITIKDKKITELSILNTKTGNICFTYSSKAKRKTTAEPAPAPITYKCDCCGAEFQTLTVQGKTITPEQQYNLLKKQSTDGIVKCKKCRGE